MPLTRYLILLLLALPLCNASAQHPADSIQARIVRQLEQYPQEKMYVHNDKPYYISGEDIWLRAHLVDATYHRQAPASRYIYGELVDPLDSVVNRIRIMRDETNTYSGYFSLDESLAAGNYTMRFYTRYMENQGESYFFRKTVYIGGPLSSRYRIDPTFTLKGSKVEIKLSYTDTKTNEGFSPKNIRYKDKSGFKTLSTDGEHTSRFDYDLKKSGSGSLYLEFEHDNKKHSQYITLPGNDDDFVVDFFPEGGHLFAGVNNKLAFKSINSRGLSEEVSITIFDDKGEEIRQASSTHKGMGVILFPPERGKTYKAVCTNGRNITKEFTLPEAQTSGYGLSVQPTAESFILSLLQPDGQEYSEALTLLVLQRGMLLYTHKWDNNLKTLTVDKKGMPSGILQFLLVADNTGLPISERLAFTRNDQQTPQVNHSTNKKNYKPREKVSLQLDIKDKEGNAVNGNLSVSVTDDKDFKPDSTFNIVSYLLLSSDLKGYIEESAYYLQNTRKSDYDLDLLMQTQGWTRYNMKAVLSGDIETPKIPFETTNIISGNVKDGILLNKGAKNVDLNVLTLQPMTVDQFKTDDKGYFRIEGYDIPDSTRFIITAKTKTQGDRLDLTVDSIIYPEKLRLIHSRFDGSNILQEEQFVQSLSTYLEKADQKYVMENGMRVINLKEVVVQAKMKRPKHVGEALSHSSVIFGKYFDKQDIKKRKPYSLKSLLQHMVVVVEEKDWQILIKGMPPIVIVDGRSDSEFLIYGMVDDIKDIEVVINPFDQPKVLINLDWENIHKRREKLNIVRFKPLGYQFHKEFYVPKYETQEQIHRSNPDLRSTIHWQPQLEVKDGQAQMEFYTADALSTYSVVIEGVTEAGSPVYEVIKIERTE